MLNVRDADLVGLKPVRDSRNRLGRRHFRNCLVIFHWNPFSGRRPFLVNMRRLSTGSDILPVADNGKLSVGWYSIGV